MPTHPNSIQNLRANQQFKWIAGKTKRISIPEIFEEDVIAFINKLDEQYAKRQKQKQSE